MTLFVSFLLYFQVNEKLGHAEAMDNTASMDVMTHKKKKKRKKEKELEEEPALLASAHLSPAESCQVSKHRTSLLFLLLSD